MPITAMAASRRRLAMTCLIVLCLTWQTSCVLDDMMRPSASPPREIELRDYEATRGEGFVFREHIGFSSDRFLGWSFWADDYAEDIPRSYGGTRGKLTNEIVRVRHGGSCRVAVLETGEVAYLDVTGSSVDGITLDSELQRANALIGKTVWTDSRPSVRGSALYSAAGPGEVVRLRHCQPLVVLGTDTNSYGWTYGAGDLFLRLRTANGEEGLYAFNDLYLFYEDPLPPEWSTSVREAIRDQRISVGMEARHVQLSWGDPSSINTTTTAAGRQEQWVYGGHNYVYFDNGKVSGVQTSTEPRIDLPPMPRRR